MNTATFSLSTMAPAMPEILLLALERETRLVIARSREGPVPGAA